MKSKFKFDKGTGTYMPIDAAVEQGLKANVKDTVREEKTTPKTAPPQFKKEKKIDTKTAIPNISEAQIVQMKRVNHTTSVQLIDNSGLPESYLDSINTGVVMFRERQDYDICQITEERTGKPLAYIGGYALQISFNMSELNTMERIEECLQGLTKLFRHKIMNQTLK